MMKFRLRGNYINIFQRRTSCNTYKFFKITCRSYMKALQTSDLSSKESLFLNLAVPLPIIRNPSDVLIKVHAASINPIDVKMLEGYGSSTIEILRNIENCSSKINTFPLTLGRDFSGIVIDTGRAVKKFRKGDKVWGALGVQRPGTHAEYITAAASTICHKPTKLNDCEAASIPYVALTSWMAMCEFGQNSEAGFQNSRVLVLGGSGGIGTFAIQLLKYWGANVTATCSSDAEGLLLELGANNVLDYKSKDYKDKLRQLAGFDFVLDTIGLRNDPEILSLLKPTARSKLVTLVPPFLKNADKYGFFSGLAVSTLEAAYDTLMGLRNGGKSVRWAFFTPSGHILEKISRIIDKNEIRPVVEKIFSLENAIDGYTHVAQGHSRGKSVINIAAQ